MRPFLYFATYAKIKGFVEGFKANLWHKKFGSISSMSLEHHAKTFELRFSTFTRPSSSRGIRVVSIFTFFPSAISSSFTSSIGVGRRSTTLRGIIKFFRTFKSTKAP
ncbi:hypothetical protein D0Y65_018574 [Glycine soja]|uniref:Uncharacterized protein n=1 Tax=Glycine soja TaxID=3848 RepID=A0A445JZT1_GLYSO|nr:hypothetical protein D0Y65_018574 [Glycine soja]